MNPEKLNEALDQHNKIVDEMEAIRDALNPRLEKLPEGQVKTAMVFQAVALGTMFTQFSATLSDADAAVVRDAVAQTLLLVEAGRQGILKESETNPNAQPATGFGG